MSKIVLSYIVDSDPRDNKNFYKNVSSNKHDVKAWFSRYKRHRNDRDLMDPSRSYLEIKKPQR